MRIGLVSDTHVPAQLAALPRQLLDGLSGVDAILHAGDLVSLEVLGPLSAIAPTAAVAGNMDPPDVAKRLKEREVMALGGWKIGLQHGHQRHALQDRYIGLSYDAPAFDIFFQTMAAQLPDTQIIVFGHFHAPLIKQWRDRLFINPGAVAPSHGHSSFGILTLDNSSAEAEIVRL